MSDLLAFVIDRHGSTNGWHQASAFSAAVHVAGGCRALGGRQHA
jgi:hypothetical protein